MDIERDGLLIIVIDLSGYYVETIIKGSGSGTALPGSATLRTIGMQPACKCTSMTNPLSCSSLVLSLQLLLQCNCSFLQLWHLENGGSQRSEARGRRLPEPQGANTQGLCVTLQLCFITIAKLNFRSQPADHTRVAPSYVMPPCALKLTRLIEGGTTKVGLPACTKWKCKRKFSQPAAGWRSDPGNLGLPSTESASKNYCNHFYKAGGTQTAKEHLGRLGVSSVGQSLNPGISGLAFVSIDSIPSWRNRRLIYGL